MVMGHMDGSWAVAGMVMMVAFWVGFVGLAIWAIESFRPRGVERRDDALDIASRRYASGEISREEFNQIRRDLGPRGHSA
jgi:uncharacterized membrane protein